MILLAVSICFVISLSAIVPVATSTAQMPWRRWTCDQLTPDLCDDLEVESGSLIIRTIPVKYWRYKVGGQPLRPGGSDKAGGADAVSLSVPIVAVHGGPGWPHGYMLPLKQLACRGAEVIFYDQAGCGESTIVEGELLSPSDYPHLLDPAYYSEEELPALIEHWGLEEYHLLGSSWGTILAQNFALNARDTAGLRSLVLSGPLSDSKRYIEAQWDPKGGGTLGSLPPFVQGRIRALEGRSMYGSAEYAAIDDVLTAFFTLRTAPAPECFTSSAKGLNRDVYIGMQGPSEFSMSGVLADWNVTGRLGEISVPVLLTHGRFDTMRPSIVKTMEGELKLAERVMLPHSGHVSMIDDAGVMNDAVADFLHRVEMIPLDLFEPKLNKEEFEEDKRLAFDALWSWARIAFAFFIGMVIGRLDCNGGYSRI